MQIIFLVVFASMDAVRIKNLNKKTDAIGCTFNIANVRMVINIYMTCVRNDDALLTSYLAGWERDSNRRTSASESDTLPTELLRLDYLTTPYTVLIRSTWAEKGVVAI